MWELDNFVCEGGGGLRLKKTENFSRKSQKIFKSGI